MCGERRGPRKQGNDEAREALSQPAQATTNRVRQAMTSRERLKQLELLGGLGGAVLGGGIALLFAEWLLPYALPAVVIGVIAHGWAMFQKHRLESTDAIAKPAAWETVAYWVCWLLIGALGLYIALAAL